MLWRIFLTCVAFLAGAAHGASPETQLESVISLNKQVMILPTVLQNYFTSLSRRTLMERVIDSGAQGADQKTKQDVWRFTAYGSSAEVLNSKDTLTLGLRVESFEDDQIQKGMVKFYTAKGRMGFTFVCVKKSVEEKAGPFAKAQAQFEGTPDLVFAGVLKLNSSQCRIFSVESRELEITVKVENTPSATFGGFVGHFGEETSLIYRTKTYFDSDGVLREYYFSYPPYTSKFQARLNNDRSIEFWVDGEHENFDYFSLIANSSFDSGLKSSGVSSLQGYGAALHFPFVEFISYQRLD